MPISGLSAGMPVLPVSSRIPQAQQMPAMQRDIFVKSQQTEALHFKGKEAEKPSFTYPSEDNLVHHLARLGAPDAPTNKRVAFSISRYFSPDGKEQAYTYGDLLRDSQKMAAGYKQQGLEGKRIAIADINTFDFLNAYYGGLAAGATMVPLNLMALQDERTKAKILSQMISAPDCEGFIIGADPAFKEMAGFQKIIKLKNTPVLKTTLQRYTQNLPPRHNGLDKLLYKKLDTEMNRKLAIAAANREEKGITLSEQDKQQLLTKIKGDFKTLHDALPAQLKLITPQTKAKWMAGKPLPINELKLNPTPDALAEVIFTPGVSGNPKGVRLSHQNMVFRAQSLAQGLEALIRPEDKVLLGLPLFNISGRVFMLTGLKRQAEMVMIPSLGAALKDPESINNVFKTIEEKNITVLPSVPMFHEKLVDHALRNPECAKALKNVRVVICGGAPLKKSTYEALKKINPDIQIVEAYGSSESSLSSLNKTNIQGFVGTPLPGVEIKLVDANGQETLEGPGEIMVKSPGVAANYVEGTFPKNQSNRIADENGFFKPGDMASRVFPTGWPERQLQVLGRKSKLIQDASGELHAPEEIESVVKNADSRIVDAMAVAYKPNRETESSVVLAITPDKSVTEAGIKKAMNLQVAHGQISGALVPQHVVVLNRDSLPEALKDDFKREAGYKAAKGLVNQLVEKDLVKFQDKTATSRKNTLIPNNEALQQFANEYRYQS